MLHRTREKASPAGTYSPEEPIRPPSAPPQARLPTYMRSSPTARNPTTQPSQKRGFRSKLITVSLPRLPPLRNNTAVLKPPPGTRARSAKQAIARDTLPMGHQPSQRAHQAHRRICRRTRHHCGGGRRRQPTQQRVGQQQKSGRSKPPVGSFPGVSAARALAIRSRQDVLSLFFACLQPSRGGVCVTHLCCPGSYVLSAGRISQSVSSGARPSLARSLGNLAKPPTHSPTSPSRSLRSDSPPGLFASMGGRSALSTGFSQHLGGNEAVKGNQAESRSRRRSTSL